MTQTIRAKGLSLQYGNKQALNGVDFELTGGKIYGLLGRNGAGKTSLLSLLASFQQPTVGTITVNGESPFENARLMEQIALVRDRKQDEETEKVGRMIRQVARFRPHFDLEYAYELVKRFKLPLNEAIKNLSRGMQSALNVTLGLASRAPITIFDEAYLGMDAPARERFYEEVLQDYMAHPRTIILSTHLISEMDSLFEEVLILKQGSLLLHETTENLLAQGVVVTGVKQAVEQWVGRKKRLKEQTLGQSKSVIIYGQLTDEEKKQAKSLSLELEPITLQQLFIHLTEEEKE